MAEASSSRRGGERGKKREEERRAAEAGQKGGAEQRQGGRGNSRASEQRNVSEGGQGGKWANTCNGGERVCAVACTCSLRRSSGGSFWIGARAYGVRASSPPHLLANMTSLNEPMMNISTLHVNV